MYSSVPTIWPTSVKIVPSISFCVVALATPEHTSTAVRVAVFLLAGTVAVALLDFARRRAQPPAPSPFEPRRTAVPPPGPPADVARLALELRAYDAPPTGGVLTLRGAWPIGTGNKFTTPTVQNGRMYVVGREGTADGRVFGFGVGGAGASQAPAPRGPSTASVPPDAKPDREG